MTQLFGRRCEVSIDTLKIAGHRVTGKVTKTYKPEPNACELQIYNLTDAQRAQISKVKSPLVKVAAGYGTSSDGLTQLFYGHALHSWHEVRGADIVTIVSTSDGGDKKQKARVNIAFDKNTKTSTVLKRIAEATGLGLGNVNQIAAQIDLTQSAFMFIEGGCISGAACDELHHLLRSCGYDWSIQDETLQIRKFGLEAQGFAIKLTPETGLIESPAISSKGVCSGTSLLLKAGVNLDFTPGKLINVKSKFVSGQFILAKCDFDFDTDSDPWYVHFEAVTKKGDLTGAG